MANYASSKNGLEGEIHYFNIIHFLDAEDNCETCDEAIANLESIDDDAEAVGVRVIQTDDKEFANEYGITEFPAVIYFENQDPSIYDGKKQKQIFNCGFILFF